MFLAAAFVLALLAPQEPPKTVDDLAKELAKLQARMKQLETENAQLRRDYEQLQKFSVDAAEKLARLRQIAEGPRTSDPTTKVDPTPARPEDPPKRVDPAVGPALPLRAKVLVVVPEYGFIIIDKGETDGVKEGWTFDVVRKVLDKDKGERYDLLGQAVFEKYVESAKRAQSKLKVTKGVTEKMKYDDVAVAVRSLDPLPENQKPPVDPVATKPEDRKYKITGLNDGTFFIDYGGKDGARATDRVFVYRESRLIAQLRLDSVEKEYSVSKIIDNTKMADLVIGDVVALKETRTTLMGKVRRNDDKNGIFIDNVGTNAGAKVGMIFEVRRGGRPVGKVILKDVTKFYSVAQPHGETKREDIAEDDIVESVDP